MTLTPTAADLAAALRSLLEAVEEGRTDFADSEQFDAAIVAAHRALDLHDLAQLPTHPY